MAQRQMSEGKIVDAARNRERGQGLLEFALVIAFLLLTMFAIIDFARVFFGYATMANGVREGARYAVVHPGDDGDIIAAAEGLMLVIGAPVDVQVGYPDGDMERGSRVVLTATSDFDVWTPIVPDFTMEARATMHIE